MCRTFQCRESSCTQCQWNSRTTRGFTLVELITTIAILGVVSIALLSLIQSFYKNNAYLIEQTAALDSSRRGIDETIMLLREASYGDDGTYPISIAGTSTITFFADMDNDASVERIRYTLVGETLYRTIANSTGTPPNYPAAQQSTSTIATNVRNTAATPIFTYFDADGDQLATSSPALAQISSIKVQLLVDLNPNRAPNVFTLSQQATLRNL